MLPRKKPKLSGNDFTFHMVLDDTDFQYGPTTDSSHWIDTPPPAPDARVAVLRAGSTYYHNHNTQDNTWIQDEVAFHTSSYAANGVGLTTSHQATLQRLREKLVDEPKDAVFRELEIKHPYWRDKVDFEASHIKASHLNILLNGEKLTGDIINNLARILMHDEYRLLGKPRTFILDTKYYWKLRQGFVFGDALKPENNDTLQNNIQHTKTWLLKDYVDDVKQCKSVMVPVHISEYHWALCVFDFEFKTIRYYDSMQVSQIDTLGMLLKWIKSVWNLKTISDWKQVTVSSKHGFRIPLQLNTIDCGVFVLKYMEDLIARRPFHFDQADVPEYRQYLVLKLLQIL